MAWTHLSPEANSLETKPSGIGRGLSHGPVPLGAFVIRAARSGSVRSLVPRPTLNASHDKSWRLPQQPAFTIAFMNLVPLNMQESVLIDLSLMAINGAWHLCHLRADRFRSCSSPRVILGNGSYPTELSALSMNQRSSMRDTRNHRLGSNCSSSLRAYCGHFH